MPRGSRNSDFFSFHTKNFNFYLEILENEERLEDMTSVCEWVGLNSIFLGRLVINLLVSKNWFLKAKWRETWMGIGTIILELLLLLSEFPLPEPEPECSV